MKERKNKVFFYTFGFIILFLFALFNFSFPFIATVQNWNVNVDEEPDLKNHIFSLAPGMLVNVDKIDGIYAKISYKKIKGWISAGNIVVYDNRFSNIGNKEIVSKNIFQERGRNFLVFFKDGKLNKFNINERLTESSQKINEIDSIYPSTKNDIFLLEGITTNNMEVHHYQVYNFTTGKSVYVGSFAGNFLKLESVQFSENSDYFCLIFKSGNSYCTSLYKTDNGELVAYAKNARWVNWLNKLLILNNYEYFWYIDIDGLNNDMDIGCRQSRILLKIRQDWIKSGRVESKIISNSLFIETRNGVLSYDLNSKKTVETPFKSLILNRAKTINFYIRNETAVLKDITGNKIYPDFSGREPKVEFVTFLNNRIIGRLKTEKIETLILYSEEAKELYRYKSVDDPSAMGDDGVIAQLNTDKDMSIITIEDPSKDGFYFLYAKE